VLQTAVPSSVFSELATKEGPLRGVLPTGTGDLQTEAWFTALPSDVQSYFQSAASDEAVLARESARNDASRWARPVGLGVFGLAVTFLGIII
jgi:hypothetical protein